MKLDTSIHHVSEVSAVFLHTESMTVVLILISEVMTIGSYLWTFTVAGCVNDKKMMHMWMDGA